jgi:hypothetical protein
MPRTDRGRDDRVAELTQKAEAPKNRHGALSLFRLLKQAERLEFNLKAGEFAREISD